MYLHLHLVVLISLLVSNHTDAAVEAAEPLDNAGRNRAGASGRGSGKRGDRGRGGWLRGDMCCVEGKGVNDGVIIYGIKVDGISF